MATTTKKKKRSECKSNKKTHSMKVTSVVVGSMSAKKLPSRKKETSQFQKPGFFFRDDRFLKGPYILDGSAGFLGVVLGLGSQRRRK